MGFDQHMFERQKSINEHQWCHMFVTCRHVECVSIRLFLSFSEITMKSNIRGSEHMIIQPNEVHSVNITNDRKYMQISVVASAWRMPDNIPVEWWLQLAETESFVVELRIPINSPARLLKRAPTQLLKKRWIAQITLGFISKLMTFDPFLPMEVNHHIGRYLFLISKHLRIHFEKKSKTKWSQLCGRFHPAASQSNPPISVAVAIGSSTQWRPRPVTNRFHKVTTNPPTNGRKLIG